MNGLDNFQELKKRILETYRKSYPYFKGDWKNFSSKDIRQLIDLIERDLKERVSEKWIYTHLKPEHNAKLPRKDMLDIFSRFAGYSGWDEFVYKNERKGGHAEKSVQSEHKSKKRFSKYLLWLLAVLIIGVGFYFGLKNTSSTKTVEIHNQFTGEPVPDKEMEVYKIAEDEKRPVKVENSKIEVGENEKVVIESPYFEKKEIEMSKTTDVVYLEPEDYAMVLKNYVQSGLKDWEDRKEKLDKILAEDLEVILMLKDNLGAEYLNKEEFAGKLIVPTSETRKMKILSLETNEEKQIIFIRIQQL